MSLNQEKNVNWKRHYDVKCKLKCGDSPPPNTICTVSKLFAKLKEFEIILARKGRPHINEWS